MAADAHTVYDNPLVTRYASREMAELWGPQRKFRTWRQLWVALAEAESELGMLADDGKTPRIRPEQIAELRAHINDIDFARAADHERRVRHDVMAHIHTYGEVCPSAKDIIHLGATSCYVTDNTDLLLMREGLGILRNRMVGVIDALAGFAEKWRDVPTLGFTHFQPAQLTTVGKRASLWCYDFILDLNEIEHRLATLKFRGAKGTTGTQASFLALFGGDHKKVIELDRLVARKMGFDDVYPVTGQTYSRKVDSQVLDALSGVGQSASKFGTDLRLLAHRQEVEEPFEAEQVGSSAMPYKRNPMRAERMCGLARYVSTLPVSAAQTAATQWLERTLDDSVNRRLTLPQAFLGTDAILRLALNIASGLVVHPDIIRRNVAEALPYMATENILMDAVAHGGDRQEIHERIRHHSHAVTAHLKAGGQRNDLIDRLKSDPVFARVDWTTTLDPLRFAGRAPEQVTEFLQEEVLPIRKRFSQLLGQTAEVTV
ncbi:adenylosuccinate lyase [Planctomycetaceae bacterium SCGC AG-212-F19]|nr:adenylosuccinate lyase [Planctomycetaceae bacterium SCGC AG-212-F19]